MIFTLRRNLIRVSEFNLFLSAMNVLLNGKLKCYLWFSVPVMFITFIVELTAIPGYVVVEKQLNIIGKYPHT